VSVCRSVLIHLALAAVLVGCQQTRVAKPTAEEREKLAKVNTQLAIEYIQKGDLEIGLDRLNKALEADPNYVDAHNTLGLLRSNLGQYDEAERSFKRALGIDPGNSSALNNYGQFLCQLKRYEEGQSLFLKAVENPLYGNPQAALSNAGTCAVNAGDLEAAEKHFRAALQIDAKLAPALYQMAHLSHRHGHFLSARGYLQRYLEVGRHSAQSLWLGIQVERELGNRDTQASYELQLEKNFPDSDEAGRLQDPDTP
jgi:type IV pilus assembly protein PilF